MDASSVAGAGRRAGSSGFRRCRAVVVLLLAGAAVVAGLAGCAPTASANRPEIVAPSVFYVPRDADGGSTDLNVDEKWPDDLTITFDAGDLKGVATIRTGMDACPVRLPVFHCAVHGTPNAPLDRRTFHLSPAKGATAGDSATLRYRLTAPGRAAVTGQTVITIGKPELEATAHADRGHADPDGRVPVSLTVHNTGDLPARGVSLFMEARHGFVFADKHRNCAYKGGGSAWCRLSAAEVTIPPGASYRFGAQELLRATSDALYPSVSFEVAAIGADYVPPDEIASRYHSGDGRAMTLVPGGGHDTGPVNADGDPAVLEVPARSRSDLVALAGTARGPVGSDAGIRVGVRNDGPGELPAPVEVEFTVPPGTTVVASPYDAESDEEVIDQRCRALAANGKPLAEPSVRQPSARRYVCTAQAGAAGTTTTFPFTLRIDKAGHLGGGRVRVTDGDSRHPSHDAAAGNDTARVTVSVWPGPSWATPALYLTVGVLLAVAALVVGLGTWHRRRRSRQRRR
ncbi:hypothetical protein [Streptomyces sp. 8L]|uniref:hypothetical protein n=1 Tax=Streptomyces sp. 8L TaxID=2877242 RepID=UPI001CD77163|nr:hypothetical protein [Streptomyces sp. 8L]MCA1219549.1 hypothetical protein [Streptomyces sp. 8L]